MENFQNEFIFWSLFFIYIKKKKIQFWITPVFLYLSGIQVIFKYPDVINFRATGFFYFFLVQPTGNTESSPNFNSRSTTEKFVIASLLVYCSTGCERENPEHICCWMHVLCPLSLQGVCAVTKKGCCCVGALEKRWTLCVCTLLLSLGTMLCFCSSAADLDVILDAFFPLFSHVLPAMTQL